MKRNFFKTLGISTAIFLINSQIAFADSLTALKSAKGELDKQIKPVINTVVVPVIDMVLVGLLVVAIAKAVISYRKGHDIELGWILLIIAGIILVSTFPTWGWQLIS